MCLIIQLNEHAKEKEKNMTILAVSYIRRILLMTMTDYILSMYTYTYNKLLKFDLKYGLT